MILRLQDEFNRTVVEAILESINETFNNAMSTILRDATVYVVSNKKDAILNEILSILERKGMKEHLKFFKERRFKNKEIVICIDDDRTAIDTVIIKVNVQNGNGYTTLSVVHFIKRMIQILQEREMIGFLTANDERMAIDKIMFGVPRRFEKSEIVVFPRVKDLPYYI